jgi:hypothetical protein
LTLGFVKSQTVDVLGDGSQFENDFVITETSKAALQAELFVAPSRE